MPHSDLQATEQRNSAITGRWAAPNKGIQQWSVDWLHGPTRWSSARHHLACQLVYIRGAHGVGAALEFRNYLLWLGVYPVRKRQRVPSHSGAIMKYPPQCTPGKYVIHHPEYVSPTEVTISQNAHGTMFWEAYGKKQMYLGEAVAMSFWFSVYRHLSPDRRN